MKQIGDMHHTEEITSTMVVHIPFIGGYWERSLEVLDISIGSMRRSTALPFDLMVLDNASCTEVQDYLLDLRRQGIVQFLVHSDRNLGKVGAWNLLFQAAPGELIAYADSDVLFLPGWLEASVDVLRRFPKSGMVTAQPARRPRFVELNSTTIEEVRENPEIAAIEGELIPEHYLTAYCHGTGISEGIFRKKNQGLSDIRLSKKGTEAYISASHFQFLTTKEMVRDVFPFQTTRALGDDIEIDVHLNTAGYWRLSTNDYFVHHMGNLVPTKQNGYDGLVWIQPDELSKLISGASAPDRSARRNITPRNSLVKLILERYLVRRILKGFYILAFKLYYAGK